MSMNKKHVVKATTFDKKGNIIAVGYNSYVKTHPKQAHFAKLAKEPYKQNLHAEIAAIIRSKANEIHKILIERYDAAGNPKLAKPCPICEIAIKMANIKLVEYTVG
jgi:deoxycytidylate deaminase